MNLTMKQLTVAFVILSLSFLWSILRMQTFRDRNEKLKLEKIQLQKKIDSLEGEIFVSELKLFRLERAHEIFEKENPQASSQLGDIISDETE